MTIRGEGGTMREGTLEARLEKGDVVETPTFGHRYRVVRVLRGMAVCDPLSQPHWGTHFYFPIAHLVRVPEPQAAPSADGRRWVRVPWSLWIHAVADDPAVGPDRRARPRTLCGRTVGPDGAADPDPRPRCALCRAAVEHRASTAAQAGA